MRRLAITVIVMIIAILLGACAYTDSPSLASTPQILDTNKISPQASPTEATDTGNIESNPFFFVTTDSKPAYKGMFLFDDIAKKDVTLNINKIADLTHGKLYELKLEHIEGVPNERLSLGYFYVQQDKIYKIKPTEANLNMIKTSEILPDGSIIVCQDTEIKDVLEKDEPGFHQYLDINGDRREFHSYNNQVSTGYYESFAWERDKGLINYQSGYGAGRDSIELHYIDMTLILQEETPYSTVIEDFILSIKNNDAESLKQMISPSGLIVIRNFCSGFGNRGKDIRGLYSIDDIPDDLQFDVIDEIPVSLHDFFKKIQQGEVIDMPVTQINDRYFGFTDDIKTKNYGPPTEEVTDLCCYLTSNDFSPGIFELGEKEVVLTESSLVNYAPIGVWAVFEKQDDTYLLRAIIDLR